MLLSSDIEKNKLITTLPGLETLWNESLGDPNITIAILDGVVDQSHPGFNGAKLTQLQTLVSGEANQGFTSQHGTHVASVIFGQHNSQVSGIAPECHGLIVPVFTDGQKGELAPCSQIDLARAITQAVEQRAKVINISGGQLTATGDSDQLLTNAIRLCEENNVLIIAATGNDGCDCLHIPAAINSKSVLAVGAMDVQNRPMDFSNWGKAYQSQGILAIGENILGAKPGGGTVLRSGTSFATPIVSGVVALLLSIQQQRGELPDPYAVRDALLKSALFCKLSNGLEHQRCLVGSLNISGTNILLTKGGIQSMSTQEPEEVIIQQSEAGYLAQEVPIPVQEKEGIQPSEVEPILEKENIQPSETISQSPVTTVTPSACGGNGKAQLVYALGELGTDFGTEARRDSFLQAMPPEKKLLDYLAKNPWEAQSLIWTLSLDATPIYAIMPMGPYANVTFERLRTFLADAEVEKVSIPGYRGSSVRLMSGQQVPILVPELRGMYSWSTISLAKLVMGTESLPKDVTKEHVLEHIKDYLNRVYYDYRNLGITAQERALNYSATNAFQASVALLDASSGARDLNSITVEKSPICRPESDCYDVKLSFFDPENKQRSNKIYKFTIDVSEVIPVSIGGVRSWLEA